MPSERYKVDEEELAKRFKYHAPHGNQPTRFTEVRSLLNDVAIGLQLRCPPSRELSLAMTKLEEAVFWANAAIARNEVKSGKET